MTICVDAAIDALKGANVTDGQYDAATKRCAKGAESNYEKSGGRGEIRCSSSRQCSRDARSLRSLAICGKRRGARTKRRRRAELVGKQPKGKR